MLPGKTFTPEEVVSVVWRCRWLILLPFSLGLALAPVIDRFVPELYRSDTVITVMPQRVPDSYVRSTITGSIADRLPSISDQILSRSRLERIIIEFDLYSEERANGIMQDVVERMREAIDVSAEGRESQSFRIAYANRNPETARRVTERLASLYIEENKLDRQRQADDTSEFLESELEDARARLVEHDQKLADYQLTHAGELPAQRAANLQAIQNAQMRLQAASDTINRARERKLLIERQLADERSAPALAAVSANAVPQAQAATQMSTEQRLRVEQARLDQLNQRYRAGHHDVRAAERVVRELEAQLREERSQPEAEEVPDAIPTPADLLRLAHERRVRDLEAQLDDIDRQVADAQALEVELRATIADYQAKVDAAPLREAELIELNRDRETLQEIYNGLLANQEESKLAASLERRQISEQIRVLDPASLPAAPNNQRERLVMMFAGAGAGLMFGLALVGFLVYRDATFGTDDEVARLLELPVLAQVPAMPSPRTRVSQRRRSLAIDVAGTSVVMASAAVLIAWGLERL